MSDTPEIPPPLSPEMAAFAAPKRKRDTVKEREARGKTRGGTPIPKPATEKEVKQNVEAIVADAVEIVTKGKQLPALPAESMSQRTRAAVLAILGEDVERARSYFADRLLATAHKVFERIDAEVDSIPASSLAFTGAVLVDKSETLRSKSAVSASGSQVNVQICSFGDGSINKAEIIDRLLGKFAPTPAEPIPVKVEKAG